jgi:hypothetical protein
MIHLKNQIDIQKDKDKYDQEVFDRLQRTQREYHEQMGLPPQGDPPLLFPLTFRVGQEFEDMDTS